jgi:hypothetical protein
VDPVGLAQPQVDLIHFPNANYTERAESSAKLLAATWNTGQTIACEQSVEAFPHFGLPAIFALRLEAMREHIPDEYVTEERHCRNHKAPQDKV